MNKRDHTIPACVIAQFSTVKEADSRDNKVYVKYANNHSIDFKTADSIGWDLGSYDSDFSSDLNNNESGLDPDDETRDAIALDEKFKKVEQNLRKLIGAFEKQEELTVDRYKSILIPYIAHLFVRSKLTGEFIGDWLDSSLGGMDKQRRILSISEALRSLGVQDSGDEISNLVNHEVIVEPKNSIQWTRLEWIKMYEEFDLYFYAIDVLVDKEKRFLLSDLGITPIASGTDPYRIDENMGAEASVVFCARNGKVTPPAYLVPMSSSVALKITPRYVIPGIYKGKLPIRYIDITNGILKDGRSVIDYINEEIVKYSYEFYIGATKESVHEYRNTERHTKEEILSDLYIPSRIQKERELVGSKLDNYYAELKKFVDETFESERYRRRIDISKYLKPDREEYPNLIRTEARSIPEGSIVSYVPDIFGKQNT